MPPSPAYMPYVTKAISAPRASTGRAHAVAALQTRQAPPSAPPARKPVNASKAALKPLDAAAMVAQTQRRLRRAEYIDLCVADAQKAAASAKRAPAPAKTAKPAVLSPPPMQTTHPRFLGPHQCRAGIAQYTKYLQHADAIRSVRPLNADERHHVEYAHARLVELRLLVGCLRGERCR